MKVKVTKKKIMNNCGVIYYTGYCNLQNLLNWFSPRYYTCGVYGWNADIYVIDGIYICTGYRPFGTVRLNYDDVTRVNGAYERISSSLPYEERKAKAIELLRNLIDKTNK